MQALIDYQTDGLIAWLSEWRIDRQIDLFTYYLSDWINE